jgi:predicted DNA repair protein MutK
MDWVGFQNALFNIFALFGGFGMFLYGMHIMADGLQKTAGNKMKNLLGALTNNRFVGVVVGALVTAIVQSSSASTVMVIGFVNAGLMNLVLLWVPTSERPLHLGLYQVPNGWYFLNLKKLHL